MAYLVVGVRTKSLDRETVKSNVSGLLPSLDLPDLIAIIKTLFAPIV